ncbi:hypothetical protein [Sphingomonas sp. SORGH_AS_0950]|uniref:hypothetical protein n=1 Tax=Sphingomonas sp. SORGH_AS_0950 TaxID=3041792 RepID=UPI0027D88D96|nr:hypothetical protein [Sphingomonas sp. SORGH_AS_0950]
MSDKIGLAGVIIAVFSSGIAQWNQVQNGRDTANALKSMAKIAKASQGQQAALDRQAKATLAALRSAQVSANAATRQAATAEASLHQSERPYVSIVPNVFYKGLDQSLSIDDAGNATVTIQNVGRSTAMQARMLANVAITPLGTYLDIGRTAMLKIPLSESIAIGNTVTISIPRSNTSAKENELRSNGKFRSFVFGKISYSDAFLQRYETKFCYSFDKAGGTETACPFYNNGT